MRNTDRIKIQKQKKIELVFCGYENVWNIQYEKFNDYSENQLMFHKKET